MLFFSNIAACVIMNKFYKRETVNWIHMGKGYKDCLKLCWNDRTCVGASNQPDRVLQCWLHGNIDMNSLRDYDGARVFVKKCPKKYIKIHIIKAPSHKLPPTKPPVVPIPVISSKEQTTSSPTRPPENVIPTDIESDGNILRPENVVSTDNESGDNIHRPENVVSTDIESDGNILRPENVVSTDIESDGNILGPENVVSTDIESDGYNLRPENVVSTDNESDGNILEPENLLSTDIESDGNILGPENVVSTDNESDDYSHYY